MTYLAGRLYPLVSRASHAAGDPQRRGAKVVGGVHVGAGLYDLVHLVQIAILRRFKKRAIECTGAAWADAQASFFDADGGKVYISERRRFLKSLDGVGTPLAHFAELRLIAQRLLRDLPFDLPLRHEHRSRGLLLARFR